MHIRTIAWQRDAVKIIDQTKLPQRLEYLYIKDLKSLWQAIKLMRIRGAPALGAAAALGVYLGIRDSKTKDFKQFKKELEKAISFLGTSRPTARNLFWGLERMHRAATINKDKAIPRIKEILFKEAQKIIEEDRVTCRRIGYYGAKLIKDKDTILTICNAGILATIDYGTALGVVYRAKEEKKRIKVYACETRPMLQGSRLTTWELKKNGIDVTLICDNMAATLMRQGKITKVITGADRIAANGDSANKIGTYNLAVLSRYHKVPFFVAAPASTFDLSIKSGKSIPIEQRSEREVTELFFKLPIAEKNIKVFNPAFDVTDNALITAIITDKGIIRPPYFKNIRKIIKNIFRDTLSFG
ncbi:MAG: S-methyl-5-thioribose-1-phosphate isomerase [Omnitrophica WOR_2 bacterium RBG_13_41_10]|nr:MAG: S-methyl-5-thioribose-1-phosphate isomerase [Omnitrophica WOR_2 bacterium RBG_13_41_10]